MNILKEGDNILEGQRFIERLLIENNRPLYQGVREIALYLYQANGEEYFKLDNVTQGAEIRDFMKSYQMQNLNSYLERDYSFSEEEKSRKEQQLIHLSKLYYLLDREKGDVTQRYDKLRNIIVEIAKSETAQREVAVYIFSDQVRYASAYLPLMPYYAIAPQNMDVDIVAQKACVNDATVKELLDCDGYYILSNAGYHNILIKLDNNYSMMNQLFTQKQVIKPDKALQKIDPIYIYIDCRARTRLQALFLVRNILMFRCKLVTWLEEDFNNRAIAELSMQRHWAGLLSTDKVGDHQDAGLLVEEERMLTAHDSWSFSSDEWNRAVDYDGRESDEYESGPLDDVEEKDLSLARKWYLLNGYINARIARLFRTMVRVEGLKERLDYNKYYGKRMGSIWQRPALRLDTVFFSPLLPGHSRSEMLKTLIGLIQFESINSTDDHIQDAICDGAITQTEEERLRTLQQCFGRFTIVQCNSQGEEYALISEYLVVILFDCFLSALKASHLWNKVDWKAELFRIISTGQACRCGIQMYRECIDDPDCDYLVIRNKVEETATDSKGKGMSQTAMKWYIEKFWTLTSKQKCVIAQFEDDKKTYIVKLPILAKREENSDEENSICG